MGHTGTGKIRIGVPVFEKCRYTYLKVAGERRTDQASNRSQLCGQVADMESTGPAVDAVIKDCPACRLS